MARAVSTAARKKGIGALLLRVSSLTFAEEPTLTAQGTQPLRDSLKVQVDAKVSLQLSGGQEISGKIVEVGD